jgi:hypothetical protein
MSHFCFPFPLSFLISRVDIPLTKRRERATTKVAALSRALAQAPCPHGENMAHSCSGGWLSDRRARKDSCMDLCTSAQTCPSKRAGHLPGPRATKPGPEGMKPSAAAMHRATNATVVDFIVCLSTYSKYIDGSNKFWSNVVFFEILSTQMFFLNPPGPEGSLKLQWRSLHTGGETEEGGRERKRTYLEHKGRVRAEIWIEPPSNAEHEAL